MSNTTCGFPGNSDIYGVGIRIGYYTQALAAWHANFFFLREAKGLRAVNGLFLLALVIVVLIYAHNAQDTHAIEVFLLMQIGFCLGSVSIMDSTKYSSRYLRLSKENSIIRLVLFNFGLAYNLYFWWFGLEILQETPCGTYAFYFVRANLYGSMRTVMKVFAIAGLVWRTIFTTFWAMGMVIRRHRFKAARASFVRNTSSAETEQFVQVEHQTSSPVLHTSAPKQESDGTIVALVAAARDEGDQHQIQSSTQQALPPTIETDCSRTDHAAEEANSPPTVHPDFPQERLARPTIDMLVRFQKIYEAELFLEKVFFISLASPILQGEKHSLRIFGYSVQITIPRFGNQHSQSTKFFSSMTRTARATWADDKNTRYIRETLSVHSKATESQIYRWPFIVSRMLELKATSALPDWRAVAIASDIQLSQMPLTISTRVWVYMAVQSFLIIAILIVQIELTTIWNSIDGIQNLNTVGELVPFILGVGGLVKVVWGKWCELRKGVKEDDELERRQLTEYEMAMQKYLGWKKGKVDQAQAEEVSRLEAVVTSTAT
ncbi:MAG: hypothetical protein Q9187_007776 [Circinaria calcarea]